MFALLLFPSPGFRNTDDLSILISQSNWLNHLVCFIQTILPGCCIYPAPASCDVALTAPSRQSVAWPVVAPAPGYENNLYECKGRINNHNSINHLICTLGAISSDGTYEPYTEYKNIASITFFFFRKWKSWLFFNLTIFFKRFTWVQVSRNNLSRNLNFCWSRTVIFSYFLVYH